MKYRSESFSGEMKREATSVMAFEIFDLGNSDILDTLSNGLLKNHHISNELIAMSQELTENGYVDDMEEEDRLIFVQRILDAIKEVTGKNIQYVLWLASRENAYRYALSGEDISMMNESFTEEDIPVDFNEIDAYDESDGVILSDLGEDGFLYGFEFYPMPLETVANREGER